MCSVKAMYQVQPFKLYPGEQEIRGIRKVAEVRCQEYVYHLVQ